MINIREKLVSQKFLKYCVLTLWGICISGLNFNVFGQTGKIKFSHLNTFNGLCSDNASFIIKDSYDYLWFGTEDGLNRYDGINFVTYRFKPNDENSLSSSAIQSIYEDDEGNLWIATLDGLCLYNRELDNFKRYFINSQSANENNFTAVCQDRQHRLWVGLSRV